MPRATPSTQPAPRTAKGRTLILGGGFAGSYVARGLGRGGATVVNPANFMLYTPLLPEAAAGSVEARHVTVPLRTMCPHADLLLGSAVALDPERRVVEVESEAGRFALAYDNLVIALGAVTRLPDIPGLREHALDLKDLPDAVRLRNQVLRQLELADADPASAERRLTFVIAGAGFAGVEAIAELEELVASALRRHPRLEGVRPRWILVDSGDRILGQTPDGLARFAARTLSKRGIEILTGTKLAAVDAGGATLSDGRRIESETVVWTAGITPNPLVEQLGLPCDHRGRVLVDETLAVRGLPGVWALGDCAAGEHERRAHQRLPSVSSATSRGNSAAAVQSATTRMRRDANGSWIRWYPRAIAQPSSPRTCSPPTTAMPCRLPSVAICPRVR